MNLRGILKPTLLFLFAVCISTETNAQKEKYDKECTSCFRLKEKSSKRKVYTEIIIDAPTEKVWQVLTDFESMPSWSSTFQGVEGEFINGKRITAHFKPDPDKEKLNSYEHNISIEEGKMFSWEGDVFAAGMTDNHEYKILALENGKTKFTQSDECNGGMTWLLGGYASKTMLNQYIIFNRELKIRAESLIK